MSRRRSGSAVNAKDTMLRDDGLAMPMEAKGNPSMTKSDDVQPSTATALPMVPLFTYQVIARGGLNLRAGPGTDFQSIRMLPLGTVVDVIKTDGPWALVDEQGDGAAEGYVFASFLEAIKSGSSAKPGWLASSNDSFVPLDKPLVQVIMDRCAKMTNLKTRLDLIMVADALNRSMILAEADTRLREVAFLSQAVIEFDYFRTFTEYGKGAGKDYRPYYGRGIHQLTWEATYKSCSAALYKDDRLLDDPDLITRDLEVNIAATAWYWRDYKPFNKLADAENIDEIIHRLYGGLITSPNPKVRQSVLLRRSFYTIIKIALNERMAGRI